MHDEPFWVNAYQLRFFDEVVREVLELCPDAWYLQVANPVLAGMTWLGRRYPQVKMVGFCHGFAGVYQPRGRAGARSGEADLRNPGGQSHGLPDPCYHDGQISSHLLMPGSRTRRPPIGKHACRVIISVRWRSISTAASASSPSATPAIPGAGPGRGGITPTRRPSVAGKKTRPPGGHVTSRAARSKLRKSSERRCDATRPVSEAFPPEHSGEVMVPLIESIACDMPRVLIGNVLNSGDFVPGIPRDFAVEIPTLVSKRGIEGIQTQELPDAVLAQIWRDRVGPVTIELAAYERGAGNGCWS